MLNNTFVKAFDVEITKKYDQQFFDAAVYDDNHVLDDLCDRCCCDCGDYFTGTLEDDYCPPCFENLPDEIFIEGGE